MSSVAATLRVVFTTPVEPAASRVDALKVILDKGYAVSVVRDMPASDDGATVMIPAAEAAGDPNAVVAALDQMRDDKGLQPGGAE